MNKPTLQKLDLQHLITLVDWAKAEGWNPGPFDAHVFYATDPDGHYGYFVGDELIAGGSIVSYKGEFGFMGLFIVKSNHRGKGFGRQLWFERRNLLLSRLKPEATIGMDGVVAMQPFYRDGGFASAFIDKRFVRKGERFSENSFVTPIQPTDYDAIYDYDSLCFGFPRPYFLKPWLELPQTKAFKFVEKNVLKGFVVIRKAAIGYKIGPLFADHFKVADALYRACLSRAEGEDVFLDIPLTNPQAVQLTEQYGAKPVFECARMYYGQKPNVDINKIFGITTFELG